MISNRCERGSDDDEGWHLITSFSDHRRFRLGSVVTRRPVENCREVAHVMAVFLAENALRTPNCNTKRRIDFLQRVPNCTHIMPTFATFRRGLCHAGNLIAGR